MLTGVAMRFLGETRKGCGLTVALRPWAWGLRGRWTYGSGGAGPRPMEHEAQPPKSDQRQLVEKERGDHGKTPSDRWRNEGILPGFSGCRISRRIQVHDPFRTVMRTCAMRTPDTTSGGPMSPRPRPGSSTPSRASRLITVGRHALPPSPRRTRGGTCCVSSPTRSRAHQTDDVGSVVSAGRRRVYVCGTGEDLQLDVNEVVASM